MLGSRRQQKINPCKPAYAKLFELSQLPAPIVSIKCFSSLTITVPKHYTYIFVSIRIQVVVRVAIEENIYKIIKTHRAKNINQISLTSIR